MVMETLLELWRCDHSNVHSLTCTAWRKLVKIFWSILVFTLLLCQVYSTLRAIFGPKIAMGTVSQ